MKEISELIIERNQMLSRCSMVVHGGRIYVRSTKFPPKPGSRSKRPEHNTGYKASLLELPMAFAVAQQMDGQLMLGTFDWEPWLPKHLRRPETIGEWVVRLEADYWIRHERTVHRESNWKASHGHYFSKLPLEHPISEATLKNVLTTRYRAGSRSRQTAAIAYAMLAEFAGLDRTEIYELGKGYRRPKKTAKDILTDDQIVFQLDNIANPKWQRAAALMAVFGLRNHEVFKADLSRVKEGVVYVPVDTKTGDRTCYACPREWIERYQLAPDMVLPNVRVKGRANRDIGSTVCSAFKRMRLCKPYVYRDAYAIRLEFVPGITPAFRSRWMGHSASVHDENYLDAIQEIHHERMFARIKKSDRPQE